jgi:hypothetical protein
MKKSGLFVGLFMVLSIFSLAGVLAAPCDLQVSMVNQDPLPAIPGEEVKLVFQVRGVENNECGTVNFELLEKYPISLSPDQESMYTIQSGTFQKNYQSFFLAPFTVRLSNDALDGNNSIEVRYRHSNNVGWVTKEFNLEVEDVRADFEVYVKNYEPATRTLTFEILNIAASDVQALTVEVEKQNNVEIKGASRNIVGDLDSNEYTTAEFEATPQEGEIVLKLSYSDSINERRVVEKTVMYEPEYFEGLVKDQKSSPVGTYIILLIIIALIVYYFYRRAKKKKAFREKLNRK